MFTLLALFTLLAYFYYFPLDTLIPFISSKPVRLTTSSQVGNKVFGCVVCKFRVATGRRQVSKCRKRRPCWSVTKPVRITFSRIVCFSPDRHNLGFLTEGNLLLYSSHLPLGVPNGLVIQLAISILGPSFSMPDPSLGSMGPSPYYSYGYGLPPMSHFGAPSLPLGFPLPQLGGMYSSASSSSPVPHVSQLSSPFSFVSGASSSTPAPSGSPTLLSHLLPVKLTQDNYLLWRAQIVPLLRSYDLLGFVNGTYPCPPDRITILTEGGRMMDVQNPEYRAWLKQDQAILFAIVSSLTPSVSGLVLFATSAYDACTTLTTSFSSLHANSQSTWPDEEARLVCVHVF
jgi:hypothetical protein